MSDDLDNPWDRLALHLENSQSRAVPHSKCQAYKCQAHDRRMM